MVRIIGIGNEFRGDDAVGLLLAQRLREKLPSTIEVIEHLGDGATLMDAWEGADSIYILDAVRSGSPVGTIHRLDARSQESPTSFFHDSTPAFALAEAVEVARKLDRLPPALFIYGIEGASFDHGAPLSPEVEAAMETIRAELVDRLS